MVCIACIKEAGSLVSLNQSSEQQNHFLKELDQASTDKSDKKSK
jgi:hypothetical protein